MKINIVISKNEQDESGVNIGSKIFLKQYVLKIDEVASKTIVVFENDVERYRRFISRITSGGIPKYGLITIINYENM